MAPSTLDSQYAMEEAKRSDSGDSTPTQTADLTADKEEQFQQWFEEEFDVFTDELNGQCRNIATWNFLPHSAHMTTVCVVVAACDVSCRHSLTSHSRVEV